MTSSQCDSPAWSRTLRRECIIETGHDDGPSPRRVDVGHTGSRPTPQQLRSGDVLAARMESFWRRAVDSAGGGGVVSEACAAYERWSAAVETERRRGRVTGVSYSGRPHNELPFDVVHGRLIDILDEALEQSAVTARDLLTALSVTAVGASPHSSVSFIDVQTLVQHITSSLQQHQHQQQVSVSTRFYTRRRCPNKNHTSFEAL